MKYILIVYFFILLIQKVYTQQQIEGWFVGNNSHINDFPWEYYTHIHNYEPLVDKNGFASCDKTNLEMHYLIETAHKHNTKFIWGLGVDIKEVLWENNKTMGTIFLNSIGNAMDECNVDGIEADYEWSSLSKLASDGIVLHKYSTKFTKYLAQIKKNIHPNKTVSCDVGVEGLNGDSYLFEIFPWVNVSMLNNGDIDYINLMSYHWKKNDILPWQEDIFIFHNLWGINKNKINLGIGLYHINMLPYEKKSPIIDKNIMKKLGDYIKREELHGAFIFAATYDNYSNPLIQYL